MTPDLDQLWEGPATAWLDLAASSGLVGAVLATLDTPEAGAPAPLSAIPVPPARLPCHRAGFAGGGAGGGGPGRR
jgi:hypothetical protein